MLEYFVFSQTNLLQIFNPSPPAGACSPATNEMSVPRLFLEKVALDAPVKCSNIAWHDPKFSARIATWHVCKTPATTRGSYSSNEKRKTKDRAALSCVDQQQVIRLKTSYRSVPCSTVPTARLRARAETKRHTGGRSRPSGLKVSEKLLESLDE